MNRKAIEAAERLRCHAETAVCTPIIGDLEIVLEELASRVDVQAAIARLKGIHVPPYGEYFADVAMVEADHNARHWCCCGAEPAIEPATCPASVSCSDAASQSTSDDEVLNAVGMLRAWIRDCVSTTDAFIDSVRIVLDAAERSVKVNPGDQSLRPKIQEAIDRLNYTSAPYPEYANDLKLLASFVVCGGPLNAERWTLDELISVLEGWKTVASGQTCVSFENLCYGASSLWHQTHRENFRKIDRKPDELSRWVLDYAGHLRDDFPGQVLGILKQMKSMVTKPTEPVAGSCSESALPQVAPPSNQCYQWIGVDFGHRVGHRIELPFVLMLNHHTGEIELVDESAIQPYPSEPIPEP